MQVDRCSLAEPSVGCDCLLWRSVDRMEEAAAELVRQGIVLETDRDAAFAALVRHAGLQGFLEPHAVERHVGLATLTHRERRALVDRYIEFSRTAKSDNERAAKLRALGVSKYQIHKWAKRYRPGALRELNVPRHRVILDLVAERPWMTLAEIVGATGLPRFTTISGLYKLWQRGELQRRKGRLKVFEYAIARGAISET